ncbi:MAG TPA: glycoside hydrolase family 31 protein [Crinalium sp.]
MKTTRLVETIENIPDEKAVIEVLAKQDEDTSEDTLPPNQVKPFDATGNRWKRFQRKLKFFWGSLFYLTYAPYAYIYSRKRDRLEKQFPQPPAEVIDNPGKLLQADVIDRGARFYFEQAELDIKFLTTDLVRLNWKPGIEPIPYAIARQDWPEVDITLHETADGWSVFSADLNVMVSVEGYVRFYTPDGRLLREECPPRREGEAWTHQACLQPDEKIYGLGERAAPLNVRQPDRTYRMWNYDAAGMYGPGSDPMYISIPLYLGLHQQGSYLVFYENSFDADFSFQDVATAAFKGGALRYYVTVGSPAQVMERYTELTGRSPLPPRWALGYHQSRWGYKTEDAVRETAQIFKTLNLPLSAIHLDIDVQVGYRAFTIDPRRFPKLGSFTQELAEQGVRFITILNPGIKHSRKSKLYIEGRMLDAFCKYPNGELVTAPVWCGWSVFPDFTNPLVRKWWSRQYEFMLDLGVAGFWHDMNEPAAFIAWGDRSLPPQATQHFMEGRGGDHREAHNLYGFLQAKAGYESLREYRPNQRPFIVSRSGWAGLQRYSWTWTGDVECTWEALRQTMATVLGLGLSGIPYSGPDIGGFQGNPSAELYLRWFQMSTFLPFYRTHCSNNVEYRAPWTYGEPYYSIIRQFLQLRYRLMPYIYTLSWQSSQKGYPLVRPLFWNNPNDAGLWEVDDAFYLGDAMLVYPVVEEGGRSRTIRLPEGQWYSFWDNAVFEGPGSVEVDAPLETIPLLVKAGTVLPMIEDDVLVLHLYPPQSGESESVVYSDAGDGHGESRLDRFRMVRFPDGVELFWEQEGDYPFACKGIQIHLHGFQVQHAWKEGEELSLQYREEESDRVSYCAIERPFKQAYFKG